MCSILLLTLSSPQRIRVWLASGSTPARTPPCGGGRRMTGGSVASVLQQVPVTPASALVDRLDVPGGRPPFPVVEPLAPLLPGGGLRRGSVVAVHGSTALLFALLAAATTQGVWAAVVGVGDLGVLAAAEAGGVGGAVGLGPRPGSGPAPVVG